MSHEKNGTSVCEDIRASQVRHTLTAHPCCSDSTANKVLHAEFVGRMDQGAVRGTEVIFASSYGGVKKSMLLSVSSHKQSEPPPCLKEDKEACLCDDFHVL